MKRSDKICCGDCAQCQLLADGEVDMVPCVLDQMFRRLQRVEQLVKVAPSGALAASPEESENKKGKN